MDDPIERWLPSFPRGEEITVAMLSEHRAGVPHRVTEDHEEVVPRTAEDMVRLAATKPLEFEPGEGQSYSSGGFSVLARVLEVAADEDYQSLLERYVLEPAGLRHTLHVNTRTVLPGRASSYEVTATGELVNTPIKDLSFLVGAGSVWSTADDLQRLVHAVKSGVFGEAVIERLGDSEGFRWYGRTNGFSAFADWHREATWSSPSPATSSTAPRTSCAPEYPGSRRARRSRRRSSRT
jgi:CubicO group peptidase (beta-lactamase class C family)